MIDKKMITRQKTLFDDEFSDEKFLIEELKRLRVLEIKAKEQALIKEYNDNYYKKYHQMSNTLTEEEYLKMVGYYDTYNEGDDEEWKKK